MRGTTCVLRPIRHNTNELQAIEQRFAGKLWAFAPTEIDDHGWGLGVFIANETSYIVVDPNLCLSTSYDEMAEHADELNEARGVTRAMMMRILRGDRLEQERVEDWLAHTAAFKTEKQESGS
jgi:hypothetical protein